MLRDGFRVPWSLVYEQLISFTFATKNKRRKFATRKDGPKNKLMNTST